MKKIALILLVIVLLYAVVVNYKFIEAVAYLHDSDLTNDHKAVALLEDAIRTDRDSKSAFLLAYYYKTKKYQAINLQKSHQNYLISAQLGDHEAKMLVAWNFYKGLGCDKDVRKSKKMLTELAINGNSKAKEVLKFVIRN